MTIPFTFKCGCGKVQVMQLDPMDVARWKNGALIQNVWPDMPKEDRELMISSTCGTCWEQMFAGSEF